MPTSEHRRKGRLRPRGKPPRVPPLPPEPEEEDDAPPPTVNDLLDWQLRHLARARPPATITAVVRTNRF